ncbi:MAG: hypothetical protein DMF61_00710 [Blastocatellia bacterium AA13]|nr:MAG: hypothetical protein DMF61_00710 [Blastocatellia bacterium AA13]
MSSNARLGAFVLIALIMFGVMVFLIGDKEFLFSRTYRIKAAFDNVAGLDEGAPVRAGGVKIGTVEQIRLPARPEEKITVDLSLEHSTRNVIKKDSVASIETEGLLGVKYLSISFGSEAGAAIHDGDLIESRPPLDYADVAKKATEMLESATEAIESSKVAIANVNAVSGDLKSITTKIDSGQGTIGALLNDRTAYQNLNATLAQAQGGTLAFKEDMDALKHNFFLRGFFKKRGYFDSSELTKHAIAKLPEKPPAKQFNIDSTALFSGADNAKLRKDKLLKPVGEFLERNPFGLAVVTVRTGLKGSSDENLILSQARAMVVRDALAQKYKLDDSRIRTLGLGEGGRAGSSKGADVTILVYPEGQDYKAVEAKTQK